MVCSCKKKSDVRKKKEISFIEKYFRSGLREKIQHMNEENNRTTSNVNSNNAEIPSNTSK